MKTIILSVCLFGGITMNAQPKVKAEKLHFSSINQVGLLVGKGGETAVLQTVNGISKNGYFAGIGTGIDFYGQRSVPLFIDLRREFLKTTNKAFIYADGGVHFQWLNFIQNENRNFPKASPGLYYEAGLGYNIAVKRRIALVLSAGYAYKRVSETFTTYRGWGVISQPAETKDLRISEYRRWVVKFGLKI